MKTLPLALAAAMAAPTPAFCQVVSRSVAPSVPLTGAALTEVAPQLSGESLPLQLSPSAFSPSLSSVLAPSVTPQSAVAVHPSAVKALAPVMQAPSVAKPSALLPLKSSTVTDPKIAAALPVLKAASTPDERDAARQFDGGKALEPAEGGSPVAGTESESRSSLSLPTKSFTLGNGLTVVVHTDPGQPVVAVSITYKVGSMHESRGLSGFAHLFEHLMAQGTKSLKPREITHVIESNGGQRNAYTMRSNTTYHSVVPKSALKTVLWAEAERMSTLNVDDRALALEQQVVLEEMRLRYVNQAYAKARDAGMAETAFKKWENQHTTIGEADDVRNARLEDVRAFYKAHYAPNNAVLALSGDVTEAEARELAERFFGPLESHEIASAPDLAEPKMTGETRRVIEDKFAQIPLLMASWNAPERGTKDYWALTLLGQILGSGESSPLYRSLVKDLRIASSASPNFPWWTGPFNPGGPELFGLMIALKDASADAALAAADAVLAKLAEDGPSADQLEAAKTSLELSWRKDLQDLIGRAQTASSYSAMVGDPAGLARDFAAVMSVSVKDVQDALKTWIVGKGRAVVEARPSPDLVLPVDPKTPPVPDQKPRPEGDPRPEIDAQAPAVVPTIERFTLSNGLTVAFVKDPRQPLLEARMILPGGKMGERPGEEGLAAAVSELLLSGQDGLDASALNTAIAKLGWKADVASGLETLQIEASGLSRGAREFFRLLAGALSGASFPEDEVALWKANKAEELKIERNKPGTMASERLKKELFGAHPYGRSMLTDAQLGGVTRDAVAAYARKRVVPGGAKLVVTGDADVEALKRDLEAAFAGWTGTSEPMTTPALGDSPAGKTVVVDRPGSKQANLTVSQMLPIKPGHPDWLAFSVMNQILGGGASGRLFLNLRVQKGYTYGAYSRPSPLAKGTLWTASAEVRNEVAAPSLSEILREVARMRDERVPAETLEATKRFLSGAFLISLSSIDSEAGKLAAYEQLGLSSEEELRTYLTRLNALTPEDIQRAARLYLDPAKLVVVAVGDEKTLTPVLKP